ncbi:MAG: hypothetical protein K1X87_04320 [Dehalococcoidia bacterium]|nr:hypothetical protein [Dehalococcoidia bacterium]
MIRKLLAGVSIAAVAAVALLLVSYNGSSAQPTEAVVASIGTTTAKIGVDFYAQLQINAEDDDICLPNCSNKPVTVTASAGDFIGFDPTGFPFNPLGCYDQFLTPCETIGYTLIDSNGFGDGLNGDFCDSLFGPGDTQIAIDITGTTPCAGPDLNGTHLEQWWQAPPGFLGGNVTFCAHQLAMVGPDLVAKCTTITVVGPVASLKLSAFRGADNWGQMVPMDGGDGPGGFRGASNEAGACKDTTVYVIAAADYSFNNNTSFNNNRAVLCAEARDSAGVLVPNVDLQWTTTKGALGAATTNTGSATDVDTASNYLTSGSTAASGDIATVTVLNGSATASVTVQFGGDPVSCTIPDFGKSLNIGDHAHVVATFVDAKGNWVPDGIIGHLEEVDSGDGADNVQFVSVTEDTVKGVIEGDVIAAIPGVTTVAASLEQVAGADPTCTEALDLSGDIHVTPTACAAGKDAILAGSKPPAAGGWGTFLFCGGTNAQLLAATGCATPKTVVIFYNKPNGGWASWVVGSEVAAANAEWLALFPNEHVSIPNPTIFTATCKAV